MKVELVVKGIIFDEQHKKILLLKRSEGNTLVLERGKMPAAK